MRLIFTGTNDFEIESQVNQFVSSFDGEIIKIDESNLNSLLFDALNSQSLFYLKKCILIKDFSTKNINVEKFISAVSKAKDDLIILIQPDIDKRTKSYKDLAKLFKIIEINLWNEKDIQKAIEWTDFEAEKIGLKLKTSQTQEIIKRADFNQRTILSTLEKISLSDKDNFNLDDFISPSIDENIFNIFETILLSDNAKIKNKIESLKSSEDAFKLFGLLTGQLIILLALKNNSNQAAVSKDLGASPYMVAKLSTLSKKLSTSKLKKILFDFTKADMDMKNSNNEPWTILSSLLIKISN